MIKIAKKTLRAIWDSTSRCYCKALKEEYPDVFKRTSYKQLEVQDFDRVMRAKLEQKGLPSRSPTIHEKYLKYLKQLSNKELELVIKSAEHFKRDGTTVHACIDELFERAANPETRRSHESKKSKSSISVSKRRVHRPKRAVNSKRNG